jgi:tRNA splicing ligase
MGNKHDKKRYFIVKYSIRPNGKYDELVELSKKKLGVGKITEAKVVLDLINKEVVKIDLPNIPKDFPFENLYSHYRQWYADAIDNFIKD